MASAITLDSTNLLCTGHLDTLRGSINTQFLKLSTKLGLGFHCQCAGFKLKCHGLHWLPCNQ